MSQIDNSEPLGFRVIIETEEDIMISKMKSMGLAVPDEIKEKYAKGTQIAVVKTIGADAFKDNFYCSSPPKVGDKILTARYAGVAISHDESLRVINDVDVLVILERA